MYQEAVHKIAGCALEVLGVHTIPDRHIFILLYRIVNMTYQTEREKNNTMKNICVHSWFLLQKTQHDLIVIKALESICL
ncbi:MAG: hypothetical protein CR997_13380 [Acidobacteria bacterium]|nr:MAG: hypothetical protein CR997_13380 [Acidobacteriota bacterium]